PGFARLAPMPPTSAARWTTSSGSASANSRAASSQEVRSYSARRATNGSCPAARKRATTCEPRKPPPPVTSTFTPATLVTVEELGAVSQGQLVPEALGECGQQRRALGEGAAGIEGCDTGRVAQDLGLRQRAGIEAQARRIDVLPGHAPVSEEGDDRLVADHELVRARELVELRGGGGQRRVFRPLVEPHAVELLDPAGGEQERAGGERHGEQARLQASEREPE